MTATDPSAPRRARLYHVARTAHLERALSLPPATIYYAERRYDFDTAMAEAAGAVQASALEAARRLSRTRVAVLEVTEPAYLDGVRRTAVTLAWLRLHATLTRIPMPVLVTYAIENLDPFSVPVPRGPRHRAGRALNTALARLVWSRLDRVVYGTTAAQECYARAFGARDDLRATLIPALPAPCVCRPPGPVAERRVAYVGAFARRKGIPQLLAAWPHVKRVLPDAELVLIGKGELEDEVRRAGHADDSIRVVVDPARDVIHAELSAAAVATLPSQPSPAWREQVGLPIVEALSHGCTIVTTSETGLAPWLTGQGHLVVEDATAVAELAQALVGALSSPLPREAVLASLPSVDGRLSADAWLFRPGS